MIFFIVFGYGQLTVAAPQFNTFYALRMPDNFFEGPAGPVNDVGYVGGYGMTAVRGELL